MWMSVDWHLLCPSYDWNFKNILIMQIFKKMSFRKVLLMAISINNGRDNLYAWLDKDYSSVGM